MQPKNLGLKFGFVALLIAMSVYAIWAKELRQGIDLKGGHVLTFEVQTSSTNVSIADIISVLKHRIDPAGLFSLEWKPVGDSRFEVRMPRGTEEADKAKQEYLTGLDAIQAGNVQRSDLGRITSAPPADRAAIITQVAKGDAKVADALTKAAQAYDRLKQASDALTQIRATGGEADKLAKATEGYDSASDGYETAVSALLANNISVDRLARQVLELYVSKREAKGISEKEGNDRRTAYKDGLDKLLAEHPNRAEQINKVASAYRNWAEKRTGLDDPADLKRMVAAAGVLEFRIAPTLPGTTGLPLSQDVYKRYMEKLQPSGEGPNTAAGAKEDYLWFPIRSATEKFSSNMILGSWAGKKYILLSNQPEYVMLHAGGEQGSWTVSGHPTRDGNSRPAVGFNLDPRGAQLMGLLTGRNKGNYMAILLDNQVYSAPVIRAEIFGSGIVEGEFSIQQVNDLVRTLNAGALQGKVNENPVSEMSIAPSMGQENRDAGLRAAFWSVVLVVVFMLGYYWLAGTIANVAMLLNLLFTLGAMSFVEAVFTLPGIAGLTLATAMAVDANVLIYERLREEQRKTQSLRMAVKNAYSNAFSAIFDSNITTLITAVILGFVGTEEVKGFAITLGLGVLFNLFTAISITRWIFQWLLERNLLKSHVGMMGLIGVPNFDWVGKRWVFWGISLVTSIIGMGALFIQGRDILGIEFSSGTQATFTLRQGALIPGPSNTKVLPSSDQVEADLVDTVNAMRKQATDPARADTLRRFAETTKVITQLSPARANQLFDAFDANNDGVISDQEWKGRKGSPELWARLDANKDGKVDRAEAQSNLPNQSYQVSTTVPDEKLLRDVVQATFATALQSHGKHAYTLQKQGQVPGRSLTLEHEATPITAALADKVEAGDRDKFQNAVGGVMFVIRGVTPPITEPELADRIQTMRLQPDVGKEAQFNRTALVLLETDPDGAGHTSFAVLVTPANPVASTERSAFEQGELKLLDSAMNREQILDSIEKFSSSVAGESTQMAVIACVLSWLGIVMYLWIRFGQASWGLAAVVALVHDVIIAVGAVAMSGFLARTALGQFLLIEPFKVDMTVIAAFLTIIGYSVNDTIVVFDRIRENRGKLNYFNSETINHAINQTLSRTLLTSSSVILALIVLYGWGGAGIHAFSFAMLIGVVTGTYSSIAVASPLLVVFKAAVLVRTKPVAAPPPLPETVMKTDTQNPAK